MSVEAAVQDRLSGILLPLPRCRLTAGVGDFGPAAYAFVDFLAAAKQRLWQVLPLNPTGYGSSPYSALSAFAGNPLLISVERLVQDGWIDAGRIANLPGHDGPADFGECTRLKLPVIEEAAANFLDHAPADKQGRFQKFCRDNLTWLPDYAMFNVLRRMHGYVQLDRLAHRLLAAPARRALRAAHHPRPRARYRAGDPVLLQRTMVRPARALRRQRHPHLGDVAIFVNYDSADVWTHPELFELDEQRRPIRVSGVPPDYFSTTGQRWGQPALQVGPAARARLRLVGGRIRRSLALYDMIRLDHFRGFEAYWSIPAEEETAVHGQLGQGPPARSSSSASAMSSVALPFVAEDLGLITPEVDELREHFGMPGMRILQFGFGGRGAHLYLPHSSSQYRRLHRYARQQPPRSAGGSRTPARPIAPMSRPTFSPSTTTTTSCGR